MNVSLPTNPGFGKYVSTLLLAPSEPLAGCDIIRSVAVAGESVTGKFSGMLFIVLPETMLRVGAALVFAESFPGPVWQV